MWLPGSYKKLVLFFFSVSVSFFLLNYLNTTEMRFSAIVLSLLLVVLSLCLSINVSCSYKKPGICIPVSPCWIRIFTLFIYQAQHQQQSINCYSLNNTLPVRSVNLERRSLLSRQQQQQEPVNFPSSSTTPASSKDPIFALVIFVALSSLMF